MNELLQLYNNLIIAKHQAQQAEMLFAQSCQRAGIDPANISVSFGNPPPTPEAPKPE